MFAQLLQKYKTVLIVLGILLVLFIGFRFFTKDTSPEGLTSQPVAGIVPEEGGDLITLLLELKSITLDTSVLQNPVFLTLQDFSVVLAPEPVGRTNPFAPLGVGSSLPTVSETDEEEAE